MGVDPNGSPLAFYGSELRRLRNRVGMTQGELARRTNYALATVSAYENGTRIPNKDFSDRADKVFGTEGDLTRLQGMVYQVSVRPWFRDRVEVEGRAIEILEYESYQIPGLLQTEDYARAVISAGRPRLSQDEIERAVAVRMTRQQILELDDETPLDQDRATRLWVVLDEAALHRLVGSPEVMRAQRDHLATMAQQPNITIQIIPNSGGVTCAYGRAFTILISASSSPVVYLEDIIRAGYLRDRDQVAQFALRFDHLRASALDDKRSLRLIQGEST